MIDQSTHEMLAQPLPDEQARQRFVLSLKRHLAGTLRPGMAAVWAREAEPAFVAEHGRPPADRDEAEQALDRSAAYRFTKAVNRVSQELMWQAVGETVYREEDRLREAAARLERERPAGGSLELDPQLEIEPIYKDCYIHLQPEGYVPPDPDGDSIIAGAFYESGGRLYSMGRGMSGGDSKAGAVIGWLRERRPGWEPKRILDLGCSAGGAVTVYAEEFPDAEVHAVDLGSSMLRYAHTRAESIGVPVHFHQMDAGRTRFPDGHFDLIVSHNLFHEISSEKRREIAKETERLLAPGGIAIHQDVDLLFRGKAHWEEAERAYDLSHNNEPFWLAYATCDFAAELREAGFPTQTVSEHKVRKTAGPGFWYVFAAEK